MCFFVFVCVVSVFVSGVCDVKVCNVCFCVRVVCVIVCGVCLCVCVWCVCLCVVCVM